MCTRQPRGIIRYIDDILQDYEFNLEKMEQKNLKTGCIRRIDREIVSQSALGYVFVYQNEVHAWLKYDSANQTQVHQSFALYQQGKPGICQLKLTGRPETYELNFAAATQENLVSGTVRRRRMLVLMCAEEIGGNVYVF